MRLRPGRSRPQRLPAGTCATTADQIADVVALLDAVELQEPLVVVAHSIGALTAVGLVDEAPERVAGVVLVDPLSPGLSAVQRAALPAKQPDEAATIKEERRFLFGFLEDPAQNGEHLLLFENDEHVARLLDQPGPVFGDLPVVVLQAPRLPPFEGLPRSYYNAVVTAVDDGAEQFAAESTRGRLVHVDHTGHNIQDDQPEVVMDAIREVMAG